MIRGERLGRPRRSARRGSIDWYMGTYDGYMEQCSIPSRFLLDSLGALELVCIGHRPCAPPPAAWPFARVFWEGFHRFCAVRCLAEHVHTRVGLQFWFVIFEVTFTQSRSTICITLHVLEISSRESSAVFFVNPRSPILTPISVVRFHREGWGAPRRARSPVPVCTTSSRSPLEVIRISTASGPGTRTGVKGYRVNPGLLRLRTNSA
jgi:hypothetical protein